VLSAVLLLLGCAALRTAAQSNCTSVDRVRIQLQWVLQAQFAGYAAAQELGYFREECLEVVVLSGGPGVDSAEWVIKDIAQFGVAWSQVSLKTRTAGSDIVIISQVFQRSSTLAVTRAEDNIKSIAQLRDKTVAMWDGIDEEFRAALVKNGLNVQTSINRISQSFSPLGLLQGRSDCVMATTYNEFAQLLEYIAPNATQLYKPENFSIFSFEDLGTATLQDSLFVSREWLNKTGNKDIAKRFLRAMTRGWIYCRDDLEGCVNLIWSGDDHQRWMMNEVNKLIWGTGETFGMMNSSKWLTTVDVLSSAGLIPADDYSEAYDMSLMSEVVAELQSSGVLVRVNPFRSANFSWCLRSASCPGASSTAYICTGNEKSPTYMFIEPNFTLPMLVIGVVFVAITIFIAAFVLHRRESIVMKSATPLFMIVMLVGIMFIYASVVMYAIDHSDVTCSLFIWLLSIGFTLLFVSLFIKTIRVYRIFNAKKLLIKAWTNNDLVKALAVFLSIDAVLLVLLQAIFPITTEWVLNPGDDFSNFSSCYFFPPILYVIIGYKGLTVFSGVAVAIMTRKVPYSFFNEARYIAISMYNFAFVSVVILIPMIVVSNVVANFMVLCLAILFTTTIALGLLFVPKIWLVARRSEDDLQNMYENEKHRFLYSSGTTRSNVSARQLTSEGPSSIRASAADPTSVRGDSKK
jgi:NitT/TauT family transport system substrate-binding protein